MGLFGKKPSKPTVENFENAAVGKAKTTDVDHEEANNRIDPWRLELAYFRDPTMFAGINLYQSFTEYARFKIHTTNGRNKEILHKMWTETQFYDTFLRHAPIHLGVYGNFACELLKDKKDNKKIVDFMTLDWKNIYPAINPKTQEVFLDNTGRIQYFVQGDSGSDWNDKKELLEVDKDIFWTTLRQMNRTDMGIGFVEPLFQDITLKENVEQSRTQFAYRQGFPLYIVEFGNADFKPNTKMFKKAKEVAQQAANPEAEWVALPTYMNIRILEDGSAKQLTDMIDGLVYTTKLQASVMQIPLPLLMQSGETEHQSTLAPLLDAFEPTFLSFQRRLGIEKVVKLYIESNGGDTHNLEFTYGMLSEKSVKEQIMRMFRLSKTGLFDPADEELRKYAKELLGVPSQEKEVTRERQII